MQAIHTKMGSERKFSNVEENLMSEIKAFAHIRAWIRLAELKCATILLEFFTDFQQPSFHCHAHQAFSRRIK